MSMSFEKFEELCSASESFDHFMGLVKDAGYTEDDISSLFHIEINEFSVHERLRLEEVIFQMGEDQGFDFDSTIQL